ncbi:HAD family phosphatase [Rhodoferax sp. GW822-FHT02A01]|uniref:HAD family hydrolase n=1 Tax=Rhodoferax sp. GW822-FHT02A01 TaxID=3141537 RepID=UPI00315CA390
MVQALIFDMDGTMVDSMPWHARTWIDFAQRHSIDIEPAELMRRVTGATGLECVRMLLGQDLAEDEALALLHEKESLYRELFGPRFTEIKGFKQFEAQARQRGLKIGVGTAGDIHNLNFVMEHLALEVPPQAVARGDEGLPGKPEPAIFLAAAQRLQTAPANCIVFEDAPHGIEAARRAGMRAVAICSGHSAAELAGPHVIAAVGDYTELLNNNFLENLHAAKL